MGITGSFGPWHALIITTLATSGVFHAIQKLSLSFILQEIPFWCSTLPCKLESGQTPTENDSQTDECNVPTTCFNASDMQASILCTKWDYDRSKYPETAMSQFNLVCGKKFWIYLSQTIYLFGYVVGTFTSGIIADKLGQKPTIISASVLVSYLVQQQLSLQISLFSTYIGFWQPPAQSPCTL